MLKTEKKIKVIVGKTYNGYAWDICPIQRYKKEEADDPLTPYDRITPMGNGGTPITGNASEISNGFADATSESYCRSSVLFVAVAR